jgi:hypothetical protein
MIMDGYIKAYEDIIATPFEGHSMEIPVDESMKDVALFRHTRGSGNTVFSPVKIEFMRAQLRRAGYEMGFTIPLVPYSIRKMAGYCYLHHKWEGI